MYLFKATLAAVAIMFLAGSCSSNNEIELFNGENLNNWFIYVPGDTPPDSVFWAEDKLINVSGIPNAYMRTRDEYEDYTLHVEWRWVAEPANSGVLLHVSGEDMLWPNCIEAQLMAGNAGDIVLIGSGVGLTIQDTVRIIESEEARYAVYPKLLMSSEKSPGEWNEYDITVEGGIIELKVNDIIQNRGVDATKSKGSIAIQSEGGPMQFRNIRLVEL